MLSFPFFSCQKLIKYKDFVLTQTHYTGNELRIDGYYYKLREDSKISVQCFYRNGIMLNMEGGALSLNEADEYIKNRFIGDSIHPINERSLWGLFVVIDKTIKFECYYPSDAITKWTYIREGIILNDTTFHITDSYRSDGAEIRERDEMYHFRQFYPKPDSTNNFIK